MAACNWKPAHPCRTFVAGPAINPMIKVVDIVAILVIELFFM